jgi:uncharacterized protein YcbK (DUF882 family)
VISRRTFLKGLVAMAGAFGLDGLAPARSVASPDIRTGAEKVLSLHNVHTGERLTTRYCADGCYDEGELDRISYLLRCHYANTVKPIDRKVLDLLCDIKERIAPGREIDIISGYRSPEYNDYLRKLGRHVAAGSLHVEGLAIDFAIGGVGMQDAFKMARWFGAGGVGKYPEFVHIDVGRVRYW